MTVERRIFGPPGTGKTSTLATHLIPEAAAKYNPENVMVCSFTRAAAKEISTKKARITTPYIMAGDTIPIPDHNVGTMHSICFKALGNPKIIEVDMKLIQMWNEQHPDMAISGHGAKASLQDGYDEGVGGSREGGDGDKLLAALNIKRNRMLLDQNVWQMDLRRFSLKWNAFKEKNGCCDFTDLIAYCLKDKLYAPGRPRALFIDEAQDMTKLQLTLARKWADDMDEILLVGDDDQALYIFAGASHDAFLEPPIPAGQKIVLGQSYRVPRLVLERANLLIERVSQREPKVYRPRVDETGKVVDGSISDCPATYSKPEVAIDLACDLTAAGKSVMIIASCSYMLESSKKIMRDRGLPFENRHRRSRKDWNPLYSTPSQNGSVGAIELIQSFLAVGVDAPYWTVEQFVKWAPSIKVGDAGLQSKTGKKFIDFLKKAVEMPNPSLFTTREVLSQVFASAGAERALARDTSWLFDNLRSERLNDRMEYAFKVGRNFGFNALMERPKITLGTIHCSPPNEKILTNLGWVRIGNLNPEIHRVASYHENTNSLVWQQRSGNGGPKNQLGPKEESGYPFVVAKRLYTGNIITIKTDKSKTRVTPNHLVQIKFADSFFDKWAVYLMKKGDWWRVGICVTGHRPYRSGGIPGRLATEQGDCGWILKILDNRNDAILEEEKIRAKFGITGLTFRPSGKNRSLSIEKIHEAHEYAKNENSKRAKKLLDSFGLNKEYPLYRRSNGKINKINHGGIFLTQAANCITLDGYFLIPTAPKSFIDRKIPFENKPNFIQARVFFKNYSGDVYSLDVFPHHHYISGGAVVHNSVKGSESDCVFLFPDVSWQAYSEMQNSQSGADQSCRVFYVGMTRAKEELIICNPNVKRISQPPRMFVPL